MKVSHIFCLLLLFGTGHPASLADDPSGPLDLPARAIFSKGPNEWNGEVLEITRGRGAIVGWDVSALREEEVTVSIEYECAKPLNQDYQLSFDGVDRFWKVPVTPEGEWSRVELGTYRLRAGLPVLVQGDDRLLCAILATHERALLGHVTPLLCAPIDAERSRTARWLEVSAKPREAAQAVLKAQRRGKLRRERVTPLRVMLSTSPEPMLAMTFSAGAPFDMLEASARARLGRAEELGRPLTVFQNRRWDGDFRTVQRLVADGALGRVHRLESRFERWKPQEPKAWKAESSWREGGGALFDFGSHLIDQALVLFGPARLAHAELSRHHRAAEDDVFLALEHDEGVTSHLWMSNVAGQPGPRLRVLGSAGAFTRTAGDIQEVQLGQGMMPTDPRYGRSEPADDGVLGVAGDLSPVRTELGSYQTFYTMLAAALRGGGPLPVDPRESLAAIEIIEQVHRQHSG